MALQECASLGGGGTLIMDRLSSVTSRVSVWDSHRCQPSCHHAAQTRQKLDRISYRCELLTPDEPLSLDSDMRPVSIAVCLIGGDLLQIYLLCSDVSHGRVGRCVITIAMMRPTQPTSQSPGTNGGCVLGIQHGPGNRIIYAAENPDVREPQVAHLIYVSRSLEAPSPQRFSMC